MTNLALNTQNSTPFNTTIITTNNTAITMNSQEIADLVQSRHDNVKISIERLVSQGVIQCPALQVIKNHQNRDMQVYVFEGEQGKRDTTIIVAQLSPTFLGTVVDRWMELEKQYALAFRPSYMIEDPIERAKKWIVEATAKQEIETKLVEAAKVIEVMQPKADVYDILANRDFTYTIRDAAKLLKQRPKDLTDWLLANGWIYGRSAASYKPCSQHDLNHLKLVASAYGTQVRVTSKGLVWIARKLKVELNAEDFQ